MVYINAVIVATIFASLVAASPVEKRDLATVLKDLKDVSAKTEALTAQVDKYNGGILSALPVQQVSKLS